MISQDLQNPYQTESLKNSTIKEILSSNDVKINLSPSELIEEALFNKEGVLTNAGALMCDTGQFTGRSPKDRFIVKDELTAETIDWGEINQAIAPQYYQQLFDKMKNYLTEKKLYVRDGYAGADKTYRIRVRFINSQAWQNLFCYNMFIRPEEYKLKDFDPQFTVICIPEFLADPNVDGTSNKNFVIVNLTEKVVLIGGTGYAGEMKKSIFSVLNYMLPLEHNVLSMHCSANVGENFDTALFFGLSGTGKTTLSADASRKLIGDDEHGWSKTSVFNFEGGCYAKVIDLEKEKEPEIYNAIKFGAIVENTRFLPGKRDVDYKNTEVTQNTRTAYPLYHIDNRLDPSLGGIPKNIFFLTCDAHGVLPLISKLSVASAMFHFLSGYTAKVAGTEAGIKDPVSVFSPCYGAPFLPLSPVKYAEMLGVKLREQKTNVWLINTGWTGGAFGIGKRVELKYTRAMINGVLSGTLSNVGYRTHSVFKIDIPTACPNVPQQILSPRETWKNDKAYYLKANELALQFKKNFKQFESIVNEEVLAVVPEPNMSKLL